MGMICDGGGKLPLLPQLPRGGQTDRDGMNSADDYQKRQAPVKRLTLYQSKQIKVQIGESNRAKGALN